MLQKVYFYYWFFRSYKLRKKFPKYKVLSTQETISEIINHQKSISRFGDGEFILLMKERGIYFQELTDELSLRLNEIISNPIENHLVSIPDCFVKNNDLKYAPRIHWINFINIYNRKISKFLDINKTYANTQISRFYMDYENKNHVEDVVRNLKKIWKNKDILFVEGEFSRLGIGNDFFEEAKSIERIICPSEHAFRKYKEIYEAVKKYGKNKLIIIALGPTATVLAYDLSRDGFWALDLGHIDVEYIWFIMNAKDKIPIYGKRSAEVGKINNISIPIEYKDVYENSIIYKISE